MSPARSSDVNGLRICYAVRVTELPLTLPSGRRVRVRSAGEGPPVEDDRLDGHPTFAGRLVVAVDAGRLTVEGEGGAALHRPQLEKLSLADFHALRDAAWRVGAIARPDADLRCRNCQVALSPGPGSAPLGELDRWYTDAEQEAEPLGPLFPLADEVAVPGGRPATSFEMAPVTVGRALPLWRALHREEVTITPALVRALGIGGLGDTADPKRIARALDVASDQAWASLETAFVLLNYAVRSHFPHVCPQCGTLHDVLAPPDREFDLDPEAEALILGGEPEGGGDGEGWGPFPGIDAFAETTLRLGREVYRERGVQKVELVVNDEVPPVDGSGEPLMGSYQPITRGDAAGYTDIRFQIDIYYRTFESMYAERPFDVEAEIRETIDHEVEHHLHYLSGHDPMDEEERQEALAELERTYGKRAVRRAMVRETLGELKTIGWFLLGALVVIGMIIAFLSLRS